MFRAPKEPRTGTSLNVKSRAVELLFVTAF